MKYRLWYYFYELNSISVSIILKYEQATYQGCARPMGRQNKDKAELFAQHLASVFKPHDIPTSIDPAPEYQPEQKIKPVTPMEIAREIDKNLNHKKSPGIDELSPGLFKELPRKAIVMLTYLFNGCLRLRYIPNCFKTAQIIMI